MGLGRMPRFAGQTREFYSVLCHSIVCGQVAREFWPQARMLRRHLLLHDAHESMIGDVPTTWKNGSTRTDESSLDARIAAEHGLEPLSNEDLLLLKRVDAAALAAEAHALGHAEAEKWWPKSGFDVFVARAFDLTVLQMQVGNPIELLHPDNSIPALKGALET